jgi:hypothetical protein
MLYLYECPTLFAFYVATPLLSRDTAVAEISAALRLLPIYNSVQPNKYTRGQSHDKRGEGE